MYAVFDLRSVYSVVARTRLPRFQEMNGVGTSNSQSMADGKVEVPEASYLTDDEEDDNGDFSDDEIVYCDCIAGNCSWSFLVLAGTLAQSLPGTPGRKGFTLFS